MLPWWCDSRPGKQDQIIRFRISNKILFRILGQAFISKFYLVIILFDKFNWNNKAKHSQFIKIFFAAVALKSIAFLNVDEHTINT